VSRILKKLLAIVATEARSRRMYVANILGGQIGILLRIWILSQLYRSALEGDAVANLGVVVWTVALTQVFGVFTHYEVDRKIEQEVQSGQIAYRLLQPLPYPVIHLGLAFGFVCTQVPFMLGSACLLTWILVGGVPTSVAHILAGSGLFLGGMLLHFLMALCIGLLALRLEDVSGFRWIYQKAWIAFGGMIMPVQLFPDWLRTIVEVLPFTHLFSSAAATVVAFNSQNWLGSLVVQWSWIVVMLGVATLLYRDGVRRLAVQGG